MTILIIKEYGSTLRKKQERLLVTYASPEKPPLEKAATEIEQIVIEGNTTITAGAIQLCSTHGIPIIFMSKGEFQGIFHPWTNHGSVAVRRAQITAYNDQRGVNYINQLLHASFTNKTTILHRILNRRELPQHTTQTIQQAINGIKKAHEKLPLQGKHIDDLRPTFFAIEAEATKEYFKGLKAIIPEQWRFNNRNRRPPRDPVNSMLSYAYTILHYKTLNAVIISGMEPYAGFLHTDRAGKPSLALDLIEEFRQPLVDRIILKLIAKKMINPNDFQNTQGYCEMNDHAKKTLITTLIEDLNKQVITPKGQVITEHIILAQARKLGKYFRQHTKTYKPFIMSKK